MLHPEQSLQRQCADYLFWALPAPHWWFTAIPSGGGGEMRGKILKGMGLKAGVPDLMIIGGGMGLAYFVELKSRNGALSPAQRMTHEAILAAGGQVAVCRSLDDLRAALGAWGIPTRETKPSTEQIRRGFANASVVPFAPVAWPESTQFGRRRKPA